MQKNLNKRLNQPKFEDNLFLSFNSSISGGIAGTTEINPTCPVSPGLCL